MRFLGRLFPWGCATVLLGVGGCLAFVYFLIGYYQWRNCWFPPTDPDVEVIVSACEEPFLSSVSPDGRYLLYITRYDTNKKAESWILDMASNAKGLNTLCGQYWLTNTERLSIVTTPSTDVLQGYEFSICNIINGTDVDLQWVLGLAETLETSNGFIKISSNPQKLVSRRENHKLEFNSRVVEWFRRAERVYYIRERDWAIALAPDYLEHSQDNYVLALPRSYADVYPNDKSAVLDFLRDNSIAYGEVSISNQYGTSHNGQFLFRDEIVYRPNGIVETYRVVIQDSTGNEIAMYDYGNKWDWLGGCSPHVYG